jgi:drug/metabolite transporter (DMT)-like permease
MNPEDTKNFIIMALVPGLLALSIYYLGLKKTPASIATLCELSFPFGAVIINWIYLDSPLTMTQIIGSVILIFSVTILNFPKNKSQPTTPIARVGRG